MNTTKEYEYPQATCLGHLQGTVLNEIAILEFIASNLTGDLYTREEITDKIKRSVERLKNSHDDTNKVMDLHYEKITK